MLTFLDAGVNVKGAPNENFAREIMEMFTMGVGNYTEKDIREAARAFTGWNYVDLKFVVNKDQHDDGEKTFLGKTGRFDGVDVIDIIMQQPVTAEFIAGKIYRYFVREDLSPELQKKLGAMLRESNYEITPLLETIFLSRDFYSPASVGTQIKSPVQLAISTYRKLGLERFPVYRTSTWRRARWGSSSFRRRPSRVGPADAVGLRLACCSSAETLLAMFCFPDVTLFRRTESTGSGEVRSVAEPHPARNGHHSCHQTGRQRAGTWRNRIWKPTAMKTSIPGMEVFAAGRWPSRESSRFRAIRLKSI